MADAGRAASRAHSLPDAGSCLLGGVFVVVALFPFYWMLRTAFTPRAAAFSLHPRLWPEAVSVDAFVRAVRSPTLPFLLYFRNSLIVSLSTALLVVLAGSGGAYALARTGFRGWRVFG